MKHDDFVIPFGKHKGKAFKDVPMEYLDWLIGWMEETFSDRQPGKKMSETFPTLYGNAISYLERNKFGTDTVEFSL
jgi:uncharacterized protein (DUF3820 family)